MKRAYLSGLAYALGGFALGSGIALWLAFVIERIAK